jgi:hypothetical protein
VQRPDGVLLRAAEPELHPKIPFAEALARIRAAVSYTGPVYDDADYKAAIDQMFRDSEAEDNRREGR